MRRASARAEPGWTRRLNAALQRLVLGATVCAAAASASAAERTVVVLLFDGWAPQMVGAHTPTLDQLRGASAWTHQLEMAFPTISLVNQVTISTGCWPARHGIVSNLFLDPERGTYDHDHDADWLLGCEHLHQAAERQGVRSAAAWWVGAVSGSRGPLATHALDLHSLEDAPDDEERIARVIELLRLPAAERPRLLLAYLNGPDWPAHMQGMEDDETVAAIRASDAAVARVIEALRALQRQGERVALAVTTDHGMVEVRTVVNIERILANHGLAPRLQSTGTTSFLYFDAPADAERAHEALAGYEQFDVWRRADVPPGLRLGASARVGDLVVSAKPPYFIEDIGLWPWWVRWVGSFGPEFLWARLALKATHGYPPETPGMDGILYFWGDGIGSHALGRVPAVDLHPTVAALLGIRPGQPTDGSVIGSVAPARTD